MAYAQRTIHTLYKKLIRFYPQEFRERLGDSMEQTFNDLYNEQKRQTEQGWFSPVLWIFVETAIGIFRERLLLIMEGDIMQTILTNLRLPAIVSFLLILPFMIMEVVNRRNFNEGFPIPLFVFMWILPMLFLLIGMPIVRNIRAGNSILANPIALLIRVAIDQMPCFLGVPNCD
jgi:hypothetical protein